MFDNGYSTSEGRNGFGLHIVDRIAEVHGWTVEVTESETDGARFEFRSIDGAFDVEGDGDDDED